VQLPPLCYISGSFPTSIVSLPVADVQPAPLQRARLVSANLS